MKIRNFEQTGLDKVANWLSKNDIKQITYEMLRELLKTTNVSFVLEGINRFQSTILCELNDSYVQQSQRYVTMGPDGYVTPILEPEHSLMAHRLIQKAFKLYEEMTEYTDEIKQQIADGTRKGRPKASDYKYGIPIEDARYILPLATTTNVSVSMSGDKLIDLFKLLNDNIYNSSTQEISEAIEKLLPDKIICALPFHHIHDTSIKSFYRDELGKIDTVNNMILLDAFTDLDVKVATGALTSTHGSSPVDLIDSWDGQALEKSRGVINRVLGYGHSGISEQARTTFGMMCSLVTYHQQLRHRLPRKYREDFMDIINDVDRPVIIPRTIRDSKFCQEYIDLVIEFKKFRQDISSYYSEGVIAPLLLNCDQIKLIISTNARMDCQMLSERTCMTAQWEIRGLSVKKLKILRELSPVLYEKALPPCVHGACKEGGLTCGKSQQVKDFFLYL